MSRSTTRCCGGSPAASTRSSCSPRASRHSGSTDSAGIIKYLNSLSKYPGYFGNYTFSPTQHNGYPTEEIVMSEASTAKNGTFALAPGYT